MPCEETSLSLVTIVWGGYFNILWRLEMGLSRGGGIGEVEACVSIPQVF